MTDKERRAAINRLVNEALGGVKRSQDNPHAELAKMLRSMHNAFMNEGFDNDEAFTLVVTILEAQMAAMATRG